MKNERKARYTTCPAWARVLVLIAVLPLAGCTYLYPGASFERDVEWNRKWEEKDNAIKEMPHTIDGSLNTGDSWDTLFPDGDR